MVNITNIIRCLGDRTGPGGEIWRRMIDMLSECETAEAGWDTCQTVDVFIPLQQGVLAQCTSSNVCVNIELVSILQIIKQSCQTI